MNNTSEAFAVCALARWFEANKSTFARHGFTASLVEWPYGSASLSLESTRHVAAVSAWNYAICLDIEIHDVASAEISFPHVGPCESTQSFERHLDALKAWVESTTHEA